MRQVEALLSEVNLKLTGILPSNLGNLRTVLTSLVPLVGGFHSLYCDGVGVCALPAIEQCFGGEEFDKLKMVKIFNGEENAGMNEATINFLLNWLTPQQREYNGPKWCEMGMYNDSGFSAQIFAAIRQV